MEATPSIDQLLLAVESEPNVWALAIPAFYNQEYFTTSTIVRDVTACCGRTAAWIPSNKTIAASFDGLTKQGVLEKHPYDLRLDPRRKHRALQLFRIYTLLIQMESHLN